MSRAIWRALGLGAMLATVVGCSQNIGEFTVLSSKNMDISRFDTSKGAKSKMVTGEDKRSIIVIVGTGQPNLKEAVDHAEESADAYGLTNARLSYHAYYIPLIYGEYGFVATGNPISR